MAQKPLNFEQQFDELELKIADLKKLSLITEMDLDSELEGLVQKMTALREQKYNNLGPWERLVISRHPERPGTTDYINLLFDNFTEFKGDRCYGDDQAIIGGIALFGGIPVTVIGHQKGKNTAEKVRFNFGMPHPEGYRKVERLLNQAQKFGRPVITFVDTQGAFPGVGAEERGQALAIASVLMTLSNLKVPIVSVVTGEGGSGGALALAVADRLIMMANAIFSVASPEASASILLKDQARVEDMAAALKLTAHDIKALGIIDEIINEPAGGAHRDYAQSAASIKEALNRHLFQIMSKPVEDLLEERYSRFRRMGQFIEG